MLLASKSGDDESDSFCNTNSLIKKKIYGIDYCGVVKKLLSMPDSRFCQ